MSPAIAVEKLTKRYGNFTALDNVNLALGENRIYGLLGRNGAGKTTLMRILTAQEFATSGKVAVFGQAPYENEAVLSRICFIKESQVYPQHLRVRHALAAAALVYPNWDERFARSLLEDFQLPRRPPGQEALPRHALRARHHHRTGLPGATDLLRRAVPGPGRGGAAALLRPAARRFQRAPPHRRAQHPPHRRGQRA